MTTLKTIALYTLGAVIGGGIGYLVADHILNHAEDEEKEEKILEKEDGIVYTGPITTNEKELQTKPSAKEVTDYAAIAKRDRMRDSIDKVAAKYLGETSSEEPGEGSEEELITDPGKISSDEIYIINLQEYALGYDEHPKTTLTYYEDDDTLADSNDDIIMNPEELLGVQALLNFGLDSDDSDTVYVRNKKIGEDFEVVRIHKSYSDTILGVREKKTERRRQTRKVKKTNENEDE